MLFQVYHLDTECGCALVKEYETSQSKSIGRCDCGCTVLWIVDQEPVSRKSRNFSGDIILFVFSKRRLYTISRSEFYEWLFGPFEKRETFEKRAQAFKTRQRIDRILKMRPKECSFAFVLVIVTGLVCTDKIQKKCSFRTRLVGLISTKTKEYLFSRHLRIRFIVFFL